MIMIVENINDFKGSLHTNVNILPTIVLGYTKYVLKNIPK